MQSLKSFYFIIYHYIYRLDKNKNCDYNSYVCCASKAIKQISPQCGFRASSLYGKNLREAEFGKDQISSLIIEFAF